MKKALLLHGWFNTPQDGWYPWLKKELEEKGYKVFVPQLKDKDRPTLATWTKCALKAVKLDEDTTIIGHSLGGVLGLKLVENCKKKVAKLITIAGWDYWDRTPEHVTFLKKLINSEKIIKNSKKRIVIHSNNDPYVTEFVAREYAKRIDAKFVLMKGKKHFSKADGVLKIPNILEFI